MNNQIHPVLVLELPTGTKLDQYNLGHQDGRCLRSPGCWRGLAGVAAVYSRGVTRTYNPSYTTRIMR